MANATHKHRTTERANPNSLVVGIRAKHVLCGIQANISTRDDARTRHNIHRQQHQTSATIIHIPASHYHTAAQPQHTTQPLAQTQSHHITSHHITTTTHYSFNARKTTINYNKSEHRQIEHSSEHPPPRLPFAVSIHHHAGTGVVDWRFSHVPSISCCQY